MFDKSFYPGCVEGPFGHPMVEAAARAIEAAVKESSLAKERGVVKLASVGSTELVKGERADISVIADDVVDRDREVVVPKGLDYSHFMKNPVVQYGHDFKHLPVGKAQWIALRGDKTKAKTVYAPRPTDHPEAAEWFPDSVHSMVVAGFLPGKSIGFVPLAGSPPTKDEPDYKGANFIIRKSILLEYSVVNVPANQNAIVEAVAKGFTIPASLVEEFHEALQLAEKLRAEGKEPPAPVNPKIAELLAQFETFDLEEVKRLPDIVRRLALTVKEQEIRIKRLRGRVKSLRASAAASVVIPQIKVYPARPPADLAERVAKACAGINLGSVVDDALARKFGRP